MRLGDLRKALLQLQFTSISDLSKSTSLVNEFNLSLWQNMQRGFYKPMIKAYKNLKLKDEKFHLLKDLSNSLNGLSLISNLIQIEDPLLNFSPVELQASLSLIEHTHHYSNSSTVSWEIAAWLNEKLMDKLNHTSDHRTKNNLYLKKKLNKGVNLALSNVAPKWLDRRIVSVDYLPYIRTICRAEEIRTEINNKRGNRFFHYLHGMKVPSTSTKPNILAAACKVMQESIKKN